MVEDWYNNTCIGDQIETQVKQPGGRYRWRLRKFPTLTRRDSLLSDMYNEEPWNYGPVPDNLKPHWMK